VLTSSEPTQRDIVMHIDCRLMITDHCAIVTTRCCLEPAGLAIGTVYQVGYTLPQYQQLVGSHLRRGGTSPIFALAALAAFGVVIVTHTFVQV
jgi:hypothetical protein